MYSQTEYLLLQRQPSRWMALVLLLSSLLACLGVFNSALSLWPSLLCVGLVLLYGGWVWPRQVSLRHPHSVTGLRFDSEGWHILRRDGSEVAARPRKKFNADGGCGRPMGRAHSRRSRR